MQASDFPTALDAFTKLVTQKPDFAEGWNKRATLYYLMEDDDKSLADIDKTLALEPRHFGAISGLGLIHFRHDRYEEAAKAYRRVLEFDPMNAGALGNLEAIKELIKKKSI
jgi:tetratricopeptide (TPR) repeat protein